MKNILITGANGFIGGYLTRYLYNFGYSVERFDRQNWKSIYSNFSRSFKFDVVIHCAANPNIREGVNPENIWDSNVKLTHEILEKLDKSNNPLFINLSSIAVYGKLPENVAPPNEYCSTIPWSNYGMSKLASEFLVNKYDREEKIRGVNLRLSGICGPHMTHGILTKIINSIRAGKETVDFFGPAPGNEMTYFHVYYLAEIIKEIIQDTVTPNTLNICGENPLTIEEIVKLLSDNKLKIKWKEDPSFINDPSTFVSDINRLTMRSPHNVHSTAIALKMLKNDYFLAE